MAARRAALGRWYGTLYIEGKDEDHRYRIHVEKLGDEIRVVEVAPEEWSEFDGGFYWNQFNLEG